MTPYYSENGITIWHGDCRDVMSGLDAESVGIEMNEEYIAEAIERIGSQGVLDFAAASAAPADPGPTP